MTQGDSDWLDAQLSIPPQFMNPSLLMAAWWTVRPNFTTETTLAGTDVDAMIRRLDLALACGNLSPREFQFIHEALLRVDASVTSSWQVERVNPAIYLLSTSPSFCIQR